MSVTAVTTVVQISRETGSIDTFEMVSVVPATKTVSSGTFTTVETYGITFSVTATDTVATVSATDTITSTDTETAPTVYPNCLNLVSEVNGGQAINIVDDKPHTVNGVDNVDSPYDCCVLCQITPLCGAMYYMDGMCSMVMADTCSPNTSLGSFESLFPEDTGYTLSNGTCGMLLHRGHINELGDGS